MLIGCLHGFINANNEFEGLVLLALSKGKDEIISSDARPMSVVAMAVLFYFFLCGEEGSKKRRREEAPAK